MLHGCAKAALGARGGVAGGAAPRREAAWRAGGAGVTPARAGCGHDACNAPTTAASKRFRRRGSAPARRAHAMRQRCTCTPRTEHVRAPRTPRRRAQTAQPRGGEANTPPWKRRRGSSASQPNSTQFAMLTQAVSAAVCRLCAMRNAQQRRSGQAVACRRRGRPRSLHLLVPPSQLGCAVAGQFNATQGHAHAAYGPSAVHARCDTRYRGTSSTSAEAPPDGIRPLSLQGREESFLRSRCV